MTNSNITIQDIKNDLARETLEELVENPAVQGIMLWGSRATEFGAPNTDYDALIYVKEEFYQTLDPLDTAILIFDEKQEPKKMIVDYTYLSDSVFESQLESPLDIDHAPYVEGVIMYDPTGKLEQWRKKLAKFPEGEEWIDRIKIKWLQFTTALYYAKVDKDRGFEVDSKLNAYRALTSAANLFFTLKKTWSPPFKWFTKYAKVHGINAELLKLFKQAIEQPKTDNIRGLADYMGKMIKEENIDLKSLKSDFLETIMPSGRKKLIKHSYM